MKFCSSVVLLVALFAITAPNLLGQDASTPAQKVEELRTQLRGVQTKEAELQARLKQLEEDLKPENIERSLAGIGSTRPEELREQRRRRLNIEKASLQAQLELLAKNRARLETSILNAEANAYQQSAQPTATPIEQMLLAFESGNPRWLVMALAGVATLLLFAVLVGVIRKRRRT